MIGRGIQGLNALYFSFWIRSPTCIWMMVMNSKFYKHQDPDGKQSLLQITLLQIVNLCIFFSPPLFYLKCIPLFQVQAGRKHTSALVFFKHFFLQQLHLFIFSSLLWLQILFPLAYEDRILQQSASLEVFFLPLLPTVKKGLHRNVWFVWIKSTVGKITGCFIVDIAGGLLVLSDGFWKDISTLNRQFSYFHIQAPASFSYLLNLILSHSVCLFVCLTLNYSQEKLKLFI